MKVRVVLEIDVDQDGWASEFGLDPDTTNAVRNDVRLYILTGMQSAPPVQSGTWRSVKLGN